MLKIILAIAFFIPALQIQAIDFLSGKRVGENTLNQALCGRSFFEAYPQVEIKSPAMLDSDEIRKDQIFLQSYPYILSSEEIVLIHREEAYKAHRFLDFLGVDYSMRGEIIELIDTIRRGVYMPVLYLKLAYKKPRPYEVMPNLAVVLDKTETPSYPSLAATENRLIAHILAELFLNEDKKNEIIRFADEMSNRRVLAGVSFPSDISAGTQLADKMKDIFMEDENLKRLNEAIKKAMKNIPLEGNAYRFDKIGQKRIKAENMPLEKFVAKLQLLTKKRIILDVQSQFLVNEEFEEKYWKVALDIFAWENALELFETEDEILIKE